MNAETQTNFVTVICLDCLWEGRSAETCPDCNSKNIITMGAVRIPDILTANTYFWSPAGSASGRRSNEARRNGEVASFIEANREALNAAGVEINFSYSESCHNVYKSCEITRNGKRSNITAVRKALGL